MKEIKNIDQLKFTVIVTNKLIEIHIDPKDQKAFKECTSTFIKSFRTLWEKSGPRFTLSYYKNIRLCFTRYLSGSPLKPNEISYRIGLTRDGIPKKLGPVISLIRSGCQPGHIRILLTLLSVGRSFELAPEISDYKSITEPSKVDPDFLSDFEDDFMSFVKERIGKVQKLPIKYSFKNFYLTLSRGPNGPAMRSTLFEAINLPKDLLQLIRDLPSDLSSRISFLRDNAKSYEEWNETFNLVRNDKFLAGKLVNIPDKEGKTRVITILNYWSQCALKPIHDEVNNILKMLPWDCTHNQGGFKSILSIKSEDSWHSVDLKDATDRFPRKLQEMVLRVLFGSDVSKIWNKIISYPVSDPSGKPVVFAAGQPMGAYSSFPVFALTHGLLVSYLASMLEVEEDRFRILGDDIVIRDDALAEKYKKFLKALDVPYSETKTMVSKSTFEFAKRWFHQGQEVSPFPLTALHESLTSIPMLVETFRTAVGKGWFSNHCAGPVLVKTILKDLGFHRIFIRKALEHYALFTSFPGEHDTVVEINEKWVKFLRLSDHYVSCVSWRSQVQSTLIPVIQDAVQELVASTLHTITAQSVEMWRCLYYAGLSPKRGINLETQKVLEWANPLLAVLRQQSLELETITKSVDRTFNPLDIQDTSQFLKMFAVLRVFSLDNLRKERTHKLIIRARAKLATKCQQILRKQMLLINIE